MHCSHHISSWAWQRPQLQRRKGTLKAACALIGAGCMWCMATACSVPSSLIVTDPSHMVSLTLLRRCCCLSLQASPSACSPQAPDQGSAPSWTSASWRRAMHHILILWSCTYICVSWFWCEAVLKGPRNYLLMPCIIYWAGFLPKSGPHTYHTLSQVQSAILFF